MKPTTIRFEDLYAIQQLYRRAISTYVALRYAVNDGLITEEECREYERLLTGQEK